MVRCAHLLRRLWPFTCTILTLLADAVDFLRLHLRSPAALAAENLFLRKQLTPYQEHQVTPRRATNTTRFSLAWLALRFVRNHAQAIVACDFCVAITATFRLLYVIVVIEHASRLLHVNVTAHPTAEWTLQQLREAVPSDHGFRFLIHDRDSIFSHALDQSIRHLGLNVLKTPVRTPRANAICERLIGTLRH